MSRLKSRFEQHMDRHAAMSWEQVKTRLEAQPEKLWSLGEMAEKMAVDILTEQQYRALQGLEPFDLKSSSWVKTPQGIRDRGGALFGDRRYDTVFIYHDGASSYFGVRGFRAMLRV
jgi:hypothetical protein